MCKRPVREKIEDVERRSVRLLEEREDVPAAAGVEDPRDSVDGRIG